MRFSFTDVFSVFTELSSGLVPAQAAGPDVPSSMMFSTPGGYPPPGEPGYGPPQGYTQPPEYTAQPGYTPPGYTPPGGYVPPPPPGQQGLSVNSASALCYVFGIITGVIFLVLEPYKRERTVRFHAFQSIFLNIGVIVIWIAWGMISGVLTFVSHGLFFFVSLAVNLLLSLGFLILWIMLLIRAAQGQRWVLPVVGPLAEKQAATMG